MVSTIKKSAPTPLEAEYKEMRKLSPRNGVPAKSAAGRKSTRTPENPPTEDIVTLSSKQPLDESPPDKLKPPQPVTPDERRALLYGFSIYG
jgi:hypothetical protein